MLKGCAGQLKLQNTGAAALLQQPLDFFPVGRIFLFCIVRVRDIRGFEYFWNFQEIRVMDNPVQGFKADSALSDVFMAVFGRAAGIFAVIDMKDRNLVFAEHLVKLLYHTVKIMHNIIPAVVWQVSKQTRSLSLCTTPS